MKATTAYTPWYRKLILMYNKTLSKSCLCILRFWLRIRYCTYNSTTKWSDLSFWDVLTAESIILMVTVTQRTINQTFAARRSRRVQFVHRRSSCEVFSCEWRRHNVEMLVENARVLSLSSRANAWQFWLLLFSAG